MVVRKLKELREEKGMMQRQVAASLDIDTAMISKIENGTKSLSKSYLPKLSEIYSIKIETLETIWLAAKVERIIEGESFKLEALSMLIEELNQDLDGNE